MARNKADEWAGRVVSALLERGELELVTPRTRSDVEALLAHLLDLGVPDPSELASRIIAQAGVLELHCDDDAIAALVVASEPTPEEVASAEDAPSSLAETKRTTRTPLRLDEQAQQVLVAAQALADERRHRDTTLSHVLVAMLGIPAIVALARGRGGDPDAARARAVKELDLLTAGKSAGLHPAVLQALAAAEEMAPRFATVGDITLAVLKLPAGRERTLFALAFQPAEPVPTQDASGRRRR